MWDCPQESLQRTNVHMLLYTHMSMNMHIPPYTQKDPEEKPDVLTQWFSSTTCGTSEEKKTQRKSWPLMCYQIRIYHGHPELALFGISWSRAYPTNFHLVLVEDCFCRSISDTFGVSSWVKCVPWLDRSPQPASISMLCRAAMHGWLTVSHREGLHEVF